MARDRSRSAASDDKSTLGGDEAIEWRPAAAGDAPEVLSEGIGKFVESMERTVLDMTGKTTPTDPRVALVRALGTAFKKRGGPPDWIVFSKALESGVDKSDDTWISVARTYSRHAVHINMHLCRHAHLPTVCIMRYPGVPGDYATYQLWIKTPPGTGIPGVWPRLVVNRPIRRSSLGDGAAVATDQQQSLPLESPSSALSIVIDTITDAGPTTPMALDRQTNQFGPNSREFAGGSPQDDMSGPQMSTPESDSGPAVETELQPKKPKPGSDRDLLIALLLSGRNRDRGPSWIWILILWALIWSLWSADLRIRWPALFG